MLQLSHVASPGNFLLIRMSLDMQGFVQDEFPMDEQPTLATAIKAANAVNQGHGPNATDCDVVKIYDDQGQWVVGGWSCQEQALAA